MFYVLTTMGLLKLVCRDYNGSGLKSDLLLLTPIRGEFGSKLVRFKAGMGFKL